jgi:hypothetical protein
LGLAHLINTLDINTPVAPGRSINGPRIARAIRQEGRRAMINGMTVNRPRQDLVIRADLTSVFLVELTRRPDAQRGVQELRNLRRLFHSLAHEGRHIKSGVRPDKILWIDEASIESSTRLNRDAVRLMKRVGIVEAESVQIPRPVGSRRVGYADYRRMLREVSSSVAEGYGTTPRAEYERMARRLPKVAADQQAAYLADELIDAGMANPRARRSVVRVLEGADGPDLLRERLNRLARHS